MIKFAKLPGECDLCGETTESLNECLYCEDLVCDECFWYQENVCERCCDDGVLEEELYNQ